MSGTNIKKEREKWYVVINDDIKFGGNKILPKIEGKKYKPFKNCKICYGTGWKLIHESKFKNNSVSFKNEVGEFKAFHCMCNTVNHADLDVVSGAMGETVKKLKGE